MQLAHEGTLAGHLGVKKTVQRLRRSFWWPCIALQVASCVRRCHTGKIVDKSNQRIPVVPLLPISTLEPSLKVVVIDVLGFR